MRILVDLWGFTRIYGDLWDALGVSLFRISASSNRGFFSISRDSSKPMRGFQASPSILKDY